MSPISSFNPSKPSSWPETQKLPGVSKTCSVRGTEVPQTLDSCHATSRVCFRHKDRTLLSSSLTPAESYNFHRALYHFWIYVEIFGGLTGVEEFLQHVEDGEIETELDLEPTRTARKTWLERLSTDDLKQMSAVVKFLVDLSASTARGDMTLSGIMDGTSGDLTFR
jgi:hypothetical protein